MFSLEANGLFSYKVRILMPSKLKKGLLWMSNGDSKAQQEHARENKQLNKKANDEVKLNQVVDKKLDGPNRPAE
jgi:hypothetical protein